MDKMILDFRNIDSSFYEFASVSAKLKEVDKTNRANSDSEEKNFYRYAEDQKNRTVSEKTGTSASPREYDQRLKFNSPTSHSQRSGKPFNEAKAEPQIFAFNEENIIEIEETSDYEKMRNPGGGNFYFVINEDQLVPKEPKVKTAKDLWRERILKTYNSGYKKETGVLVNLAI